MKKILLFSIICLSYILQADESQKDIDPDIEKQDLYEKRSVIPNVDTWMLNSNSNSTINVSSPSNPSAVFTPAQGSGPDNTNQFGYVSAANAAASLAGVAGSPASEIAAAAIAPSLVFTENNSSSSTGPTNRTISNASSSGFLSVTTPSLNGATFNFTAFTGTATGGTFSLDLATLSNTTVTQNSVNAAPGTLIYVVNGTSAPYSNINLTGATIDSATVTGASVGDYFTGTDVTAGTISDGNFDIVFIQIPTGSTFDIVAGDLGPTGRFTATGLGYGYLTGTNGITSITNGEVRLIGSVQGKFTYFGTDVFGATLQGSTIFFTGVYAAGTAPDANHFNPSNFTGTIGNAETSLTINYQNFSYPVSADGINITGGGVFEGQTLSIPSLAESINNITVGASVSFNSATGYIVDTISIDNPFLCTDCTASATGASANMTDNPIVITDGTVQGSMFGTTNGVIFTGTNIIAGDIDGTNILAGSCT